MIRILVVEDDKKLNQIVCDHLNQGGYQATGCFRANDAYNEMHENAFDLIISDIMMPEIDGYELAKTVRKLNENIPILFMTARDDFLSKQKGYESGIDDYMVKPIQLEELGWHIQALLRRANIQEEKKLIIEDFVMDGTALTITYGGEDIPVTVREFNILYKLLSYPNKTFSREQLLDEFWEMGSDSSLRSVDVYITRIRDKFSRCPYFKIRTVYGLGYKVVQPK